MEKVEKEEEVSMCLWSPNLEGMLACCAFVRRGWYRVE